MIVVTGALGHIGSWLVRELPDHVPDDEIVIIDNMATQRYTALFDLPKNGRYRFIEGDVTEMDLEPVLEGARAVVHLAAITDAATSFEKRGQVERVNFAATKRVAEACAAGESPLFAMSTTSVYGTLKDVVDEDCAPEDLKPQSPYAETKLREGLIKIGAKVVRHGGYMTFQLADVAVSRALFDEILRLISSLRPRPAPT